MERSPLNIVHAGLDVLRSELSEYMKSQDSVNSNVVDEIESICSPTSDNMPNKQDKLESEYNSSSLQQGIWKDISPNHITHKQERLAESILDLLDDICESSDAAINILNDLLNYEHMDAGRSTFNQGVILLLLLQTFDKGTSMWI